MNYLISLLSVLLSISFYNIVKCVYPFNPPKRQQRWSVSRSQGCLNNGTAAAFPYPKERNYPESIYPNKSVQNGTTLSQLSPSSKRKRIECPREILNLFKENYGLCALMFPYFPKGIKVSILKEGRSTLSICGDELDPFNWKRELVFLEFVEFEGLFDEIHFKKLLIPRYNKFFYKLLFRNRKKLVKFSMTDCTVEKEYFLRWNFEKFVLLETVKITNNFLINGNLEFLLLKLPSSLKSLDVATTEIVYLFDGCIFGTLKKLKRLEEIRIRNVEDKNVVESLKAIFSLAHLKSVHLLTSLGSFILNFLSCYMPK